MISFENVSLYDWVPFFKELTEKIGQIGSPENIANRDEELMQKAGECFGSDSSIYRYRSTDPFSFIYFLAQKNTTHQRETFYNKVKEVFNLQNAVPSDWIFPSPPPNATALFHDAVHFESELLWRVFFQALDGEIDERDFKLALSVIEVGVTKLTQTLFLINPYGFIAIDSRISSLYVFETTDHRKICKQIAQEGYVFYRNLISIIASKFPGCKHYEINLLCYLLDSKELNISRNFFQVGSNAFGGNDKSKDDFKIDFYNQSAVWVGGPTSGMKEKKQYPIYDPQKGDIVLSHFNKTGNGIGIVLDNEYRRNKQFDEKFRIKVIWINKTEREEALNSSQMIGFSKAESIRESFKKKYPETFQFLSNISESIKVMENILKDKMKNIVLQGAPGTGKTRLAKQLALYLQKENSSMACFLNDLQKGNLTDEVFKNDPVIDEDDVSIKLVQFHPSYTYEDFVRGIVTETDGEKVSYITKNKTIAEFATVAKKNFEEFFQKNDEVEKVVWIKARFQDYLQTIREKLQNGKYYFNDSQEYASNLKTESITLYSDSFSPGTGFIYEIERIEKFLLECFDGKFRPQTFDGNPGNLTNSLLDDFKKFAGEAPTSSDNEPIPLRNFVLIIDEINRANLPSVLGELIYALEYRGEPVESMYDIDGDRKIIIPPNLYIIGTMNTADRSVGHIDYAIRRRFAFIDILPDKSVIKLPLAVEFFEAIEDLFEKHTASDFEKQHVLLGHSYFLADDNKTLKLKLKYEVLPILNEYLNDGVINKTEASVQLLKEISDKIDKIDE